MIKPNMTEADWDEHYREHIGKYMRIAAENMARKELKEKQAKNANQTKTA